MSLSKFFNWVLVVFWAALIFFLSSRPELKTALPTFFDFILRKIAHMSEYAVLCFLIFRALRGHSMAEKKSLFLAVIFSIFYAISDEYHQVFVFGRQGRLFDVIIDTFGIIIASKILNNSRK